MDRQVLSLVKPILDSQLHWNNEEFGWVNAAFQATYAVGLLGFGWLVDRFGSKIGYAISIAAWSLAAIGHSLVFSVGGFIVARACLGLSEGGNFPSAIKTATTWFPIRERAFATSVFNSGANVGAVIAPATIPWIAYEWGWQAGFIAVGVAGLLWLIPWLLFYHVPEKEPRLTAEELTYIRSDPENLVVAAQVPWVTLLKYRQAWSFVVAKFLTDPIWWFFLIWLPDFFNRTRHLDLQHSWLPLVTIYSIVTVLSISAGWLTGYLTRFGWTARKARKIIMGASALCVLPILAVSQSGNWVAVLLIGLAAAAHQAWSANLYTTVSDMFPRNCVASVIGLGGTAGSIGGILFPIYTGKLLDQFQRMGNETEGYRILFIICATAYIVAFVVNHLLAPGFRPIQEEKAA
jgi:ACS family hexuronate transporter-like MFS transporter